jgi:chaperone required for assembly of F1-ATPase
MIRHLLHELAKDAIDPVAAARRGLRPPLRSRFYQAASVGEREGAHVVLLDGKIAKTPAKRSLALPTRALAQAVAAEWAAQSETIDFANMPLTRLVHLAVDRVADEAEAVAAEVAKYAGSDLLFYRAAEPAGLAAAQAAAWDPVLAWASEALGARFALAEGVRFVAQPAAALIAIRIEVGKFEAPFVLAALASATTLTGSALLALALARRRLTLEQAWAAAHVDEDWNMRQWGEDADAAARRAARFHEFAAAARLFEMLA